jgi:hypothetical protein
LAGSDFTKQPSWNNSDDAPRWYDDREDEEPSEPYTDKGDFYPMIEFVYLFDTEDDLLYVFDGFSLEVIHIINKFGLQIPLSECPPAIATLG